MNETLNKLQEEIKSADLDPAKKAELESLVEQLKGEQTEKDGLMADLGRAIEEFESSHPKVTGLLSRVSNFLSNSGI